MTEDASMHDFDMEALDYSYLQELSGYNSDYQPYSNKALYGSYDGYNYDEYWTNQWQQGQQYDNRQYPSGWTNDYNYDSDYYWQHSGEANHPPAYDGFSAYNKDTYDAYASYYGSEHAVPHSPPQYKPQPPPPRTCGPPPPPPFFNGPPPPLSLPLSFFSHFSPPLPSPPPSRGSHDL